jgi:CheY-like chemotaxis protein
MVADAGPGVPADQRDDLFRWFMRRQPDEARPPFGIGLGLAVVKAVVLAHNGRVGIEDRPGGGSIFWFELPSIQMIALVVDDDRVLADLIAFTLRREGFQVMQAHDGEAALRRWQEVQPSIIILDVNMPRLDGFAVCRTIRQQDDVPIILLTVREEEDDIVHGLESGADDYILKPFSPRQLVARMQAILRRTGRGEKTAVRQTGPLTLDLNRRELRIDDGRPSA